MKRLFVLLTIAAVVSAPAFAAPNFFDDFESGVSSSIWTKWTGANDNLLGADSSHNITPAGSLAARAYASDPAAWNGYADFGATPDSLIAEVWLFEDFSNPGTNPSQPVTNMLSLYGNGASPGAFTDYMQLGVVPFYPGGSVTYGYRTPAGIFDTGVSRKAGWTKLAIAVDSVAAGGQVRFYIDNNPVGTAARNGVDLRWVRLGNNSKSYENFWYDDVRVVPEPGSIVALGGGLLSAMGLMLRRRSA